MEENLMNLELDNNLFTSEIKETEPTPKYKVKVTCSQLRRRRTPNLQGEIVGIINDEGIYNIYDEANGWGQLDNGDWIMLSYTEIVN